MGITAVSGPFLSYGITQGSTGVVSEYNEERGPSLFDLGFAIADPRYQYRYNPGNSPGSQIKAFFANRAFADYVPFAKNSSVIAPSTGNAPVAGTALTLTPLASFGAIQTTIIAPETGQSVSVIALDSTAATLNYGQSGTVAVWNPAAGLGRTITIINSSNTNSELYTVNGRDVYGFKMTELIGASTTSTGAGQGRKAFKYIQSVTPATNTTISATGVGIGTADTFGFPLVVNYLAAVGSMVVSSTPLTPTSVTLSSANAALASTATATSTTPDVRGTFTSSIATTGTTASLSTAVRITTNMLITSQMTAAVTATDTSVMFGVTQFSNF